MLTIDFAHRYIAAQLGVKPTNDFISDVNRALTQTYATKTADGTVKPQRLMVGFMVVTEDCITLQQKVKRTGLKHSDATAGEAFARVLKNWDGKPKMLVVLDKKPITAAGLFVTHDPRAAVICTPAGAHRFDATQPKADDAGKFERIVKNAMEKL